MIKALFNDWCMGYVSFYAVRDIILPSIAFEKEDHNGRIFTRNGECIKCFDDGRIVLSLAA